MKDFGMVGSIILIFYGLLTRSQGWDDQLSNTIENITIYGGLLGLVLCVFYMIKEHKEMNKKYKHLDDKEDVWDKIINKKR